MRKIVLITSLALTLSSCNGQKKESVNIIDKPNNITVMLKKQLEYGIPTFDNPYQYKIEDFEAIIPEIEKKLQSSGFKFLNDNEFNNRIHELFNRTVDSKLESKFLCINFIDKCDKEFYFHPNNMTDFYNIFVVKNRNYITESFAIPQILDYEKQFPNLIQFENELVKSYKDEHGENVKKYLWKDENNLSQKRQKNINILVNRNKYLFNDSKASLVWLKFNDQYFLESLVKTFGYVKDLDLLKWVLDRNLKDEEFDKVLFTKTCDNKYVFHKEIFEIMNQADKSNKEKYIAFLKEHFPKVDKNNFSDETKIQALYCYYSTKLTGSVKAYDMYAFFPRLNDEESEQEFKKNNYYNLSDFKELYDETRFSGVGPAE
jgi:hypothetical protein